MIVAAIVARDRNAYCGNCASRRKRTPEPLWRNRTGGLLADRGVGQFRREGNVVRERRLENTGRARFRLSQTFATKPLSALAALLDSVARRADDFDVIHCHLD